MNNAHYFDIIKNITGKMSIKIVSSNSSNDDPEVVKEVIEKYKNILIFP